MRGVAACGKGVRTAMQHAGFASYVMLLCPRKAGHGVASAAMVAAVQIRHSSGQCTECSAQHPARWLRGDRSQTSSKCGCGCCGCASPPPVGPAVPGQELLAHPAQLRAPMQHVEPHPQVVQLHGDLPPAGRHKLHCF